MSDDPVEIGFQRIDIIDIDVARRMDLASEFEIVPLYSDAVDESPHFERVDKFDIIRCDGIVLQNVVVVHQEFRSGRSSTALPIEMP